jgi:hypothetical protein
MSRLATLLTLLMVGVLPAPQSEKAGRLSGTVVEIGTGTPIVGARIFLQRTSPDQSKKTLFETTMLEVMMRGALVETDSYGQFQITGVPEGDYRVIADLPGYMRQEYGATKSGGIGTVISIKDRPVTISLQLAPAGIIVGRVADENGLAIPNATIQAYHRSYGMDSALSPLTYITTGGTAEPLVARTNDLGEYRLYGVPPGETFLGVSLESAGARVPSRIELNQQSVVGPEIDNAQPPISTKEGAPLYYPGVADQDSAAAVPVTPARETVANITWRHVQAYVITGRLSWNNNSLARPTILVIKRGTGLASGIRTRVQGNVFEISRVLPGSYAIIAAGMNQSNMFVGRVGVDMNQTDIAGVNMSLQAPVGVSGRVVSGPGTMLPKKGISVKLTSIKDTAMLRVRRVAPVTAAGTFSFTDLPLLDYHVDVEGVAGGYVESAYFGAVDVLSEGFAPNGADLTLNVRLSLSRSIVTGTVLDGVGKPVSGAVVALVPDEPSRQRSDLYRFSSSDGKGMFRFDTVIPNAYTLFAIESIVSSSFQNINFLRGIENRGKSIKVEKDATVDATLTLIPKY